MCVKSDTINLEYLEYLSYFTCRSYDVCEDYWIQKDHSNRLCNHLTHTFEVSIFIDLFKIGLEEGVLRQLNEFITTPGYSFKCAFFRKFLLTYRLQTWPKFYSKANAPVDTPNLRQVLN